MIGRNSNQFPNVTVLELLWHMMNCHSVPNWSGQGSCPGLPALCFWDLKLPYPKVGHLLCLHKMRTGKLQQKTTSWTWTFANRWRWLAFTHSYLVTEVQLWWHDHILRMSEDHLPEKDSLQSYAPAKLHGKPHKHFNGYTKVQSKAYNMTWTTRSNLFWTGQHSISYLSTTLCVMLSWSTRGKTFT